MCPQAVPAHGQFGGLPLTHAIKLLPDWHCKLGTQPELLEELEEELEVLFTVIAKGERESVVPVIVLVSTSLFVVILFQV